MKSIGGRSIPESQPGRQSDD